MGLDLVSQWDRMEEKQFVNKNEQVILIERGDLLYNFTHFIHPSILNITNITPHSPDDGSAEPKPHSVDFVSQ